MGLQWPLRPGWREAVTGRVTSWRNRAILLKTRQKTAKGPRKPKRTFETISKKQFFELHPNGFVESYSKRDEILQGMGYPSYGVYIKSLRWSEIRQQAFKEKGQNCTLCGMIAHQIHHSSYDEKTLLGESLDALWPICGLCHNRIERDINDRKRTLSEANQELGLTEPGSNPPMSSPEKSPHQYVRQSHPIT